MGHAKGVVKVHRTIGFTRKGDRLNPSGGTSESLLFRTATKKPLPRVEGAYPTDLFQKSEIVGITTRGGDEGNFTLKSVLILCEP